MTKSNKWTDLTVKSNELCESVTQILLTWVDE